MAGLRLSDGRITQLVSFVQRHASKVVGVSALLTVAAAVYATRLELRTSFAELLPSRDPGVVELHRLEDRIGGFEALVVAIDSPNKEANLRYAAAVAARFQALPREQVDLARYEVHVERSFFEQHKWLYADLSDLEAARDRLQTDILKRKNPLFVPLDEGESWDQLRDRLRNQRGRFGERANGYFMSDDGTFVAVVVVPAGGLFGSAADQLYASAQRITREVRPADYDPRMQVGLSGDIVTQIQERHALEKDLAGASALAVALIGLVVVGFFGRWRSLPLMAAPALMGTTLAFALAEAAFGFLNSSTAFLGSIIIGNGINYAIIQLTRYEEERAAGADAALASQRAVAGTIRATAVAAGAASISYGSLMLTRFRGFSQFGLIGGVGMILCWLATIIVLPAVLYLLDRRKVVPRKKVVPGLRVAAPLARLTVRHPLWLLGAGMLLTVCGAAMLPRFLHDPFEYDFRNLRGTHSSGRAFLGRIEELFGRSLSPAVVLADRPEDVGPIEQAIRRRDAALPSPKVVEHVITLQDILPGDPSLQQRKIAVLREIRGLMNDPGFDLLDDDERAKVEEWRPPDEAMRVLSLGDLPPLVLKPFRERDGTLGRVLLVYPPLHTFSTWNGHDLMRLAEVIGEVRLPDGRVVRSSGSAVVFAAMIRSIIHDAPIATGAAFAGAAILVIALSPRRRHAALVLGVLLAGLIWMIGAAAAAHERVNFLNFIALPITFGIGVDYGINIYLRYALSGRGSIKSVVRATGGAVALCSLTTILGYGSLLLAHNRALRSFGGMAILGEFATLLAALVMLPAFLSWRERRSQSRRVLRKRLVEPALQRRPDWSDA